MFFFSSSLTFRAYNYLKILILPDQLLPGKDLIGLDALKAVPSLFILEKTQMFK